MCRAERVDVSQSGKKPSDPAALTLLCCKNSKEKIQEKKVLTPKKRKSFDFKKFFFVLVWLRVPIYLILFRLKFSSLCGHMIKCSLIELGRAGRENIWFSVAK